MFDEACPVCGVRRLAAQSVRHVTVTYLDGSDDTFPAAVIIQCQVCGTFLVGSWLMQQVRLIPQGGES